MIERLHAGAPPTAAPDWTEHNGSDPGVTLLELSAFVAEGLLYRTHLAHGTVGGLAVKTQGAEAAPAVQLSPGMAVNASGESIAAPLSGTTSRYIGETEKNLAAAFGGAVPAAAVLLHEDSDSLFDRDP